MSTVVRSLAKASKKVNLQNVGRRGVHSMLDHPGYFGFNAEKFCQAIGYASLLGGAIYFVDRQFMQDKNDEKFSYTRFPNNRFWFQSKW